MSAALSRDVAALTFGAWRLRVGAPTHLGVVVDGLDGEGSAPADYVNAVLLAPEHRETFFALIDRVGLVVCRAVGGDDALHRDVRGRSSRGRLSQGEFFHHDGCSGPVKPRVVEIRCPYQDIERHTATAIAPFPEVVAAMLRVLPSHLRVDELARWHDALVVGDGVDEPWDAVQGAINRVVRRSMKAEVQRGYLRDVDAAVVAYRAPWEMGESRFIANANAGRTMQHRRAYLEEHTGNRPNGRLVKRWPAGPDDVDDEEVCAR